MERTAGHSNADALESPCALSPESRLDVFHRLVQGSPDGLAAGDVTRHCRLPAPVCSFHLNELDKGGVLSCCRHGTSQMYTVNFRAIRALLGHLTEHCCSAEECDHKDPQAAESGHL